MLSLRFGKNDSDNSLLAGEVFLAVAIHLVRDGIDLIRGHCIACCQSRHRHGVSVIALLGNLMGDNQVVLGLNGSLHIVPHNTRHPGRCRHGSRIRIAERELRFSRLIHAYIG